MSEQTIAISKFKAHCLRLLDEVHRTGQPLTITRRGKPIAKVTPPPQPEAGKSWFGCMRGRGEILGDIVSPICPEEEWDALRDWEDPT